MYVASKSHRVQSTPEKQISAADSHQDESMFRRFTVSTLTVTILTAVFVAISGCSVSRVPESLQPVEGVVTIRGNQPFSAPVLQKNRNYYILKLAPEQ